MLINSSSYLSKGFSNQNSAAGSGEFVSKLIRPQLKPELKLELKPITESNAEEIAHHTTKIFCNHEPITIISNIDEKSFFNIAALPLCLKTAHQNLGVTAYDKSNGKWVGALLAEDAFTSGEGFDDPEGKFNTVASLLGVISEAGEKVIGKPTKLGEYIHVNMVILNQEYARLGILTELTEFFQNEHPLGRNARYLYGEITNSRSQKTFLKSGWKIGWEMPYAELEQTPSLRILKDPHKFMSVAEKCYFMYYSH